MKSWIKLSVALVATTTLLSSGASTSYAFSGGHATGHASGGHATAHPSSHPASHPAISHPAVSHTTVTAHTSTSHISTSAHASTHTTVRTSGGASMATRSTPASRGTLSNSMTRSTSTARTSSHTSRMSRSVVANQVASRLPYTRSTMRSIRSAQRTSFYRSLRNPLHQTDYVFWHSYYGYYYRRNLYRHYYLWMPYWMAKSRSIEAQKMRYDVQRQNMKWIKVNDKLIAVPENVYNKTKVGDSIELLDNQHIKINDHVYARK